MYRKLTLFGAIFALVVIVAGTLARLIGTELLFGLIQAQEFHVNTYYFLAAVTLVVLLMSWWQTHCRVAAISTAICLIGLLGLLEFIAVVSFSVSGDRILILTDPSKLGVLHLPLEMIIFWLFFWLYLRVHRSISILAECVGSIWFARFAMVLLFLQIVLGSWVSINHASLACIGFPQCNGKWWPDADYQGALNGLISGIDGISAEAQIATNWLHRLGALVCFILLNGLMLVVTNTKYPKLVRKAGLWLSFLLFVQVGLSVVGYKLSMPLWINVAHTSFAALLMLPLIAISFYSRYGTEESVARRPKEARRPKIATAEPVVLPAPELRKPDTVSVEDEGAAYVEPAPESLYLRLKSQLAKTRTGLGGILNFQFGQKAGEDLIEEIEATLLMADVGIDVTAKIINRLTQSLERQQLNDSSALTLALKQELLDILAPCSQPLKIPQQDKPFVILVIGVNGVGKTTTIGKLAKRLKAQGHSVMLAAGDTFRAAAVEQLQTWGERNGIHVVAQHTGADSASVIFDGIQSAQSKGVDVLIADTAGRLHTKSNLMEELKKVKRIMAKLDESAPHEVLLVLDAGTGQNALSQAKLFNETIGLTGLVLTKLDGTAKGGVIFALAKQSGVPIRFIGVGEGIDDLQDFNAENFVDALFVKD